MQLRTILLSEHVRKRVQLGVVPVAVGAVSSFGTPELVDFLGTGPAIALLASLVVVQVYLIVARVWLDFLGRSG